MSRRGAGQSEYSQEVEDWFGSLTRCHICWLPRRKAECLPGGFQHVHIIPRSRRVSHERFNLLGGCSTCHNGQHGMNRTGFPALTVAMLLWIKRESDGASWQPHELEWLRCSRLPDLQPLPDEYLSERNRNCQYQLPLPVQLHSDAAQQLMLSPFWLPRWTLTQIRDDSGVHWEVIDGPRWQFGIRIVASAETDVGAVALAIEMNRKGT